MNYGGGGGGGGYEAYGNDDYAGSGGGGFMSIQPSGSQATPTKRSGGAQSILPVSIKQLQTLGSASGDDDALRLDGQELSTVRIVGLLTNLTPHSTSLRFQLDDGSGAFDCQYFVTADDPDASEGEMNRLREGSYVRVVGKLRSFQGKASLSCFNVAPVEDMNELTHHLLEVIYVHCYNTKGPVHDGKADVTMASFNTPTKAPNQWNQPAATGGFGGGAMDYGMMDSNFSPEQKAILDVLGTCTSDRGLKIDQIYADLRGQMTEPQLRSALNYLTSEGHVYSTIDEDHFKRTA
ncbi:Replication protein A 32 kDa subunit [Phytophthora cinnamomi]|uniref:Replication protein A 32 kDa subunit n=1 Tax=Phytophthora cinnamomi TaxID=4785 RepID=UPI00355A3FB5|nr:Replication protein A 32 kDa subunit [Phytophthora cinnamomi]